MGSYMLRDTKHSCQWRAICPFFQRQGKSVLFADRNLIHKFLRNSDFYLSARNPSIAQFEVGQDYHFWTYARPEIKLVPAVSIPKRWLKKPKAEHHRGACTYIHVYCCSARKSQKNRCSLNVHQQRNVGQIYTGSYSAGKKT